MSVLLIIRGLFQRIGLIQPTAKAFGQPFALPSTDFQWHETYVWYPVVPFDEGHVFWLETTQQENGQLGIPVFWRRSHQTQGTHGPRDLKRHWTSILQHNN